MGFDSAVAVLESVKNDHDPPSQFSHELRALWLAKKGDWHGAHDLASDIHSKMGSWIHAHLHVLEGDLGNAAYWYRKAGREPCSPEKSEMEWLELVEENL